MSAPKEQEHSENLSGTVLFVFQPAEEGPPPNEKGGAREMLAEGALEEPAPTIAFGFHVVPFPKGYIGYRIGNQFGASCLVKIVLTGQQVHGSMPSVHGRSRYVRHPEAGPHLGYDDVSEFVNKYGGLYVTLGVQDVEIDMATGMPRPVSPERWCRSSSDLLAAQFLCGSGEYEVEAAADQG